MKAGPSGSSTSATLICTGNWEPQPHHRHRLCAGTNISSIPGAIDPLSAQIVAAFQQIKGLPTAGLATTGVNSGDYPVLIPFRDYSDKGDLRLDYAASASARYFLRVSDRKETEIDFPTIPLPLEGQTAGPQRILDQQVAIGYTGLSAPTGSSICASVSPRPKPARHL